MHIIHMYNMYVCVCMHVYMYTRVYSCILFMHMCAYLEIMTVSMLALNCWKMEVKQCCICKTRLRKFNLKSLKNVFQKI